MISRRRFLDRCGRCAAGLVLGTGLPRAIGTGVARGQEPGTPPGARLAADVDRWTRSVCDLCGLGEPVFLGSREGVAVAVKGIPQSRTGFGRLCPRARALTGTAATLDRALVPQVRRDPSTKGTLEGLEPVSWEEALAAIARGFGSVRDELGPDGIAFLASDAETCETYHRLARLARAGIGTDHVDTPARLDALHAYDACRSVFGVPANPGSVEDLDAAELIVLIGGDLAESHPGLHTRVLDARRTGRARVVLVDAQKTIAAVTADVHLRPRPGHELAVVNALAARLLDRGADGSAAWATNPTGLAEAGLTAAALDPLVGAWRDARSVVTVIGPTALGAAAGAALARAAAQLHRATGQWGAPGRGPLFLPRGGNATGVVALGIRPGHLPAGGRLLDPADREALARRWSVAPHALPPATGLPALAWPAAMAREDLGAVFVLRTNAAAEMPDAEAWRRALTGTFVVTATTHAPTETTPFADVVLPLALVAGESAGTMMTLDRRCQLLEPATPPPGDARPADRLIADVARAVLDSDAVAALFPSREAVAIDEWDRFRELGRGTVFDVGGVSVARLRRELDVAWPCRSENEPGTTRITPESAAPAVFVPTPAPPDRPAPDDARPFLLVTGPVREHERSRLRTGRTAELHYEVPTPRLEMHPDDGRDLGLPPGEWVTVASRTGSATVRLWLTDRVPPGVVFLPEHFGFLSDMQGGSATQKEPEGLAHRVTSGALVAGTRSPAGLIVPVSIRKARRRDMRDLGV